MSDAQPHDASTRDVLVSIRNAVKLGGSLLATWGIALAVRFPLKRYLGPELVGPLSFAEAFSLSFFVLLSFGLDTYIRKVIPVRPEHASDFFGTVFAFRAVASLGLFAAMSAVLHATGQPTHVRLLVYAFGAAHFLVQTNQSLAAMLHSTSQVDGLSLMNVVSKVLWGGGILLTLALKAPLWGIPASLFTAEAAKCAVLFALARRHVGLRWTFQPTQARAVVFTSLPFYVNALAYTFYNKLDVSVLKFLGSDAEVGFYSAASDLAEMTLLLVPMVAQVLMPLFARAWERSESEYYGVIRRSLELILTLAVPATLAIALGAELWIQIAFGEKFGPSALPLRILAPQFLLTYVAIISAASLNLRTSGWTVTLTSLAGMVVNPIFIFAFLGPSQRWLGTGMAGCAVAQVATEFVVTAVMMWLLGRQAFDARTASTLARTVAVCAVVFAVHLTLAPWGYWRLLADGAVYVAAALLFRAVRPKETFEFARAAFRRRRATA